ncbi:hypothetical protein ACFV4K_22740 [Nocardia sp. NPDC059764]|uniref:hypothetical protein n=1 Tax=Nocardia sp. NPDC059764 TaxID=3346939 RepID=UPI00365C3F22
MPDPRVARSYRRSVAKADYGVTMDRAFAEVMPECAGTTRRPGGRSTDRDDPAASAH